jgi:serine/threonine protein kinase
LIECVADENSEDKKIEFLSKVDLTKVPFEIKIADFGFSKYLSDSKYETSGTMCGTPLYMSPQIVDDQRYTYKTDIWSLGVIYYELLTGKYPFHAEKM